MLEDVKWLGHAAFLVTRGGKNIYFDPWKLPDGLPKADIIFISHDHYDHCNPEDVQKVQKPDTAIVATADCCSKLSGNVVAVKPGDKMQVGSLDVQVIAAYNQHKDFHPRSKGWVGYVVNIDGLRVYHVGDSDHVPEMKGLKPDIVFIPVGGKYTMDAEEAARAIEDIGAKVAVPMHFGTIIGSDDDAKRLVELVKVAEVQILKAQK